MKLLFKSNTTKPWQGYAGKHCKKLGKKIGSVFILGFSNESKPGDVIYKCLCDCGNIIELSYNCRDIMIGIDNKNSKLKNDCACKRLKRRTRVKHAQWQGCGDLGRSYWNQIKYNAEVKNRIFDVSIEFLWDLFLKQNRKCAISNVELTLGNKHQMNASLDRIDSSKGYTEDNVQWVHKDVNRIKQNFQEDNFLQWCKIITDYQENKNKQKLAA
ncbi:MAG TPA: hypothetical protein PLD02_14675 [Saprospiraceae bacterium]|nr:hypothetical protein [Saprospiraceae bacterium]